MQFTNWLFTYILAIATFNVTYCLTTSDLYTRVLHRERNIDRTFASQFVRPIGSVAGELIWPRSYSGDAELLFDENGAAYNLHRRPSLHRILQRTQYSSLRSNRKYDDDNELKY